MSRDDENLTSFALKAAEKVDYYIVREDGVLICGGWTDILSNEELLKNFKRRLYVAHSAKEAVEPAFSKIR